MEIKFLTVDTVIKMHESQILTFGGQMGIRDKGLLDSAINSAQASFSGQYLHADVYHKLVDLLAHLSCFSQSAIALICESVSL